ncbi:hypothetical protein QWZ08_20735 [Ferruginibacter paludis]|uniref:hypothetical protein n=1 Tax=Ferruginibacter paludis TaxID=1310417 RepID=UPI0025B45810|nr:hypothetical protein [Ferruginibacter paludis]MDN3658091.1 hypothetical protein [Ferruginibacter paludis]
MIKNIFLFICSLLFYSLQLLAQTDPFSGTWQMVYSPDAMPGIKFQLQIGPSQQNILYPAHILISCDSFFAEYDLLLAKKNIREVGISKNKFPRVQKPFGLKDRTLFLTGSFDLSKDLKGAPVLNFLRIHSKQKDIIATTEVNSDSAKLVAKLKHFLGDEDISLKKISSIPWHSENSDDILEPALSPTYFGLKDTVYLPTRDGIANFSGIKKRKNDRVSVTLNGIVIFDKIDIEKKTQQSDILLRPGLNILTFFADNFGNDLPNSSRLNLEFGNKKFALDFANRKDSAAIFIAVKLICDPDKSKDRYFAEYPQSGLESLLKKDEKLVGSIKSVKQQLTLAIWDEVIDDGDTVSIKINNEWLIKGCPVKKTPRFITVTLQPGANTITFLADNLGSIPPNTSVLEIIDGKRRKSYEMESNPGEKNLIKIFYDSGTPIK